MIGTSSPKALVVIPAFNAETTLERACASLRGQTLGDWVCVLVDDGSTDNTSRTAAAICRLDSRFTLLRKENAGPSAARNSGARAIPYDVEYVFFLDADDELEPECLAVLTKHLDVHRNIVSVGSQYIEVDTHGRASIGHRSRFVPGRFGMPRDLGPSELETPLVTFICESGNGIFYLHRMAVFNAVGGFDEGLPAHEDADLLCRIALKGIVHLLPDPLYRRHVREGSQRDLGQALGSGRLFEDKWVRGCGGLPVQLQDSQELRQAVRYRQRVHVPMREIWYAWQVLCGYRAYPFWRRLYISLGWISKAAQGFLGVTTREKNLGLRVN